MRVIRVGHLHQYFSHNELSGWPDGIQYSYMPPRRKVRVKDEETSVEPPKVVRVSCGEIARQI